VLVLDRRGSRAARPAGGGLRRGKLPSSRPAFGSYSSASRPRSFERSTSRPNSSCASSCRPSSS
jgi:hypothetical protein